MAVHRHSVITHVHKTAHKVLLFGILSSPKYDCTNEGVCSSTRNHTIWNTTHVTLISLRLSFITTYILASLVVLTTVGTESGQTVIPTRTFLLSSSYDFYFRTSYIAFIADCTEVGRTVFGTCYVLVTYCFSECHFNDHRLTRISMAISHPAKGLTVVRLSHLLHFS